MFACPRCGTEVDVKNIRKPGYNGSYQTKDRPVFSCYCRNLECGWIGSVEQCVRKNKEGEIIR